MRRSRSLPLFLALSFILVLLSCSSGPPPAQKGTPPFYWQAANETWRTLDYLKTNDHLSQLVRSQNEFTARAQPWLLVLSSGMARGYMDLADAFENGARQNKANPTPFRRQTSDSRAAANRLVLQFVEQFEKFEAASKDEKIPLAFPFPSGSSLPVTQLTKAGSGIMLSETDLATAQKRAVERAVLMAACRAAGAPEDTAKAQEAFKQTPPEVPRATFMLAMAATLYEQSQIFASHKLDQPDRLKMLLQHAGEVLKPLPDSKEKKDLEKKVETALKDLPKGR